MPAGHNTVDREHNSLPRLQKLIKHKVTLGVAAWLVAALFWFAHAMQSTHMKAVKLPVTFAIVQDSFMIVSSLPTFFAAQLSATGWDFLRLKRVLNQNIEIKLKETILTGSWQKHEIEAQIADRLPNFVKLLSLDIPNYPLQIQKLKAVKVAVIPQIMVQFAAGHGLIQPIKPIPDSVFVFTTQQFIQEDVYSVFTETKDLKQIKTSLSLNLKLENPNPEKFYFDQKNVWVNMMVGKVKSGSFFLPLNKFNELFLKNDRIHFRYRILESSANQQLSANDLDWDLELDTLHGIARPYLKQTINGVIQYGFYPDVLPFVLKPLN